MGSYFGVDRVGDDGLLLPPEGALELVAFLVGVAVMVGLLVRAHQRYGYSDAWPKDFFR